MSRKRSRANANGWCYRETLVSKQHGLPMHRRAGALLLAGSLAGCAQPSQPEPPAPVTPSSPSPDADSDGIPDASDNCVETANPNQVDSDQNGWGDVCETSGPDIVVLTFSGHDPNPLMVYNGENLGLPGGAGASVAGLFGGTVQVWSYQDELYSVVDDGVSGFLGAWNDGLTLWSYQYGATGIPLERPTYIIVMAHSHGTNWSHLWVNSHPELTVDLLIDLDGVSWAWEAPPPGYTFTGDDWGTTITDYENSQDPPWYPERTFADVTGNWLIDGTAYDEKDTFGANVWLNIEVWSNGSASDIFPVDIRDEVANMALDGRVG